MKISKQTLSILGANASINEGVVVQAGNVLQAESVVGDAFVQAKVEETFPTKFAIADVGGFIRTLSLFEDPELEFDEKCVRISTKRNQCTYYYGEESYIAHGNWLTIPAEAVVLSFDLAWDDIQGVQKAAGILNLDELLFTNKNGMVHCSVVSRDKVTENIYGLDLGSCDPSIDFNLVMRKEIFNFFQGDYVIKIAQGKTLVFCADNKDIDISYQISLDRKSTYNA